MTIENALYDDGRVLSAAAVGVPDTRLGELPAVLVVLKHDAKVTEAELMESVKPRYAIFSMLCSSLRRLPLARSGAASAVGTWSCP